MRAARQSGAGTFAPLAILFMCSIGDLSLSRCVPSPTAPVRSPSLDYAPPAPTMADGQSIGADGKTPSDCLAEGATLDRLAPGWSVGPDGLPRYDPSRRVGGAIAPAGPPESAGRARPAASAPSRPEPRLTR